MKKIFMTLCLVSIFSFSFFSCASKEVPSEDGKTAPETELTEDSVQEETPEEENKEESADSENNENSEASENSCDAESEEGNAEKSDEVETVPEYEELPEITEPEVFEEELPPVPETVEAAEPEEEVTEPVTEEETSELPELPPEEALPSEKEKADDASLAKIEEDSKDKTEKEIDRVIERNNTQEDEVEDLVNPDGEELVENPENPSEPEITVQIVPSRSVSMKKGESLDVVYPGKGWIFLGCTDGSKNLTSTGRKTSDKNTSFTLMARVSGTVTLHFYKEDILGDQYIDDYLEVKVSELKSKPSVHVKAPDYADAVPKKPAAKVSKPAEAKAELKEEVKPEEKAEEKAVETKAEEKAVEAQVAAEVKAEEKLPPKTSQVKRAEPKVQESAKPVKTEPAKEESKSYSLLSGEEYMAAARKALDEKNFTEVYNNLQNFLTVSENNRDEALFLLGQLYEGNSEYRNIKKSVETYEELIQNYPLSSRWEEAEKRVIYLKRFYINIR